MNTLLRQLRPHGTPRLFRKRENILFQGEIPRGAYFILDGVVRAYTITASGEERIAALYGKGDVFPIAWAFGEAPNALFYYDAVSDVRLLHIPHEQFIATISSSPETLRAVLTLLGKDYTALLLRVTGLSQSRTIDKICYTLYYLLFRYGQEKTPGEFTINLKLSQSMLADLIGQTREGTAKNIKILREKEIISYSSLTYVVNKKKLEQFLGEDSFRDIKLS